MQDKFKTIPNFSIPPIQKKGESNTKVIDRKVIPDVAREILIYTDLLYRPPPKPIETLIPEIP